VVGDSFTVADVYLGSGIGFGTQFGVIEKRPAFERYCHRLSARPAALRAKEYRRRALGVTVAAYRVTLLSLMPDLKFG
jgi:glutathione S-transferase